MNRLRDKNDKFYDKDDYDEEEWQKSETFVSLVEAKKNELRHKQSEAVDYDELETNNAQKIDLPTGRSIFDDVDE